MTRRSIQAVIAASVLFLAIALAWFWFGRQLYWTKGVVDSCTRSGEGYVCQVELVPDGTYVPAQSVSAVPGGDWVELRAWRDVFSGAHTYTVVH